MNIYIICAVRKASKFRVNIIREHVEKFRAAGHNVHFPPDDVEILVQQTKKVMCNAELRQAMVERGLQRAREFSWDRTAGQLLDVFEEMT